MPIAPKQIKRHWQKPRIKQQRVVDMSWFYNSWKWRKFSKAFKQRHPICCKCEAEGVIEPATVTDHIVRYVNGGPGFDLDNLTDENYQPLCDFHHNQKSGKEAHGFKQKK